MPYLGSTLFITTIALLILSSLLGSILLASACLGPFLDRSARAAKGRPFRSIAVGAPLLVTLFLISAAFLNGGPFAKLLGAVGAATLAVAIIVALASVALNVGTSLSTDEHGEPRSRRLLRGAVVLELAAALPFFGWFVVLPIAVSMGAGAAARALVSPARSVAMPAPPRVDDVRTWDPSLLPLASEAHVTRD